MTSPSAIVDRNDRPGGHWNDAYPFVRLHQPSSTYGVSSSDLGSGLIDHSGLNSGFHELASGQEALSHFDSVIQHRLIPSGRVRYFPMGELDDAGVVTSRLSGRRLQVDGARFVDATYSNMAVPSTSTPSYAVGSDVACVPVNDLPSVAHRYDHYVVVGAGKTGMDDCVWLLRNGADRVRIRWIVPRDSWVLNRANVQPGEELFARFCKSLADQVEAVVGAESIDVSSLAWNVPMSSDGSTRTWCPRRTTERSSVTASSPSCARSPMSSASGGSSGSRPMRYGSSRARSAPDLSRCTSTARQPAFPAVRRPRCSTAIGSRWNGCERASRRSAPRSSGTSSRPSRAKRKNRICAPISPPTVPRDWLRVLREDLANRRTWNEYPQLQKWLAASRLDPFAKFARTRMGGDVEATGHIQRYLQNVALAPSRIDELLAV